MLKKIMLVALLASVVLMASRCGRLSEKSNQDEVEQLKNQINELIKGNENVPKYLQLFDTLDFTVFTKQQWERLHESHAKDILVHWPDGRVVKGIEQHIKDLDAMFVYAPDTRVEAHPVKIGQGNKTAVMGIFAGTFTKPMPIGNGKFMQPTGKKFKIPMCTIGIWNDEGVMSEEYLFWDNKAFMDQVTGVAEIQF